jgi:hypothetical protein
MRSRYGLGEREHAFGQLAGSMFCCWNSLAVL